MVNTNVNDKVRKTIYYNEILNNNIISKNNYSQMFTTKLENFKRLITLLLANMCYTQIYTFFNSRMASEEEEAIIAISVVIIGSTSQ